MNRTSGTCGTIPKGVMFISLEFQKKMKKNVVQNCGEEIIAENFPNLVNDINLDSRSTANPDTISSKELIPRHLKIKLLKMKDKENIFKSARQKKMHCI